MRRLHRCSAIWLGAVAAAFLTGCKSDFNQQLPERELRLQEDQIYQLQDELSDKCVCLGMVAAENQSLKRQLGIGHTPTGGPRSKPTLAGPPPGVTSVAPPSLVPPTVEDIPPPPRSAAPPADGSRFGAPGSDAPNFPGGTPALPALEGVPPLPDEPGAPKSRFNGASVEKTDEDKPPVLQLSHEQSVAAAPQLTHLVLSGDRTECLDGDGDGVSELLVIVLEPRDADERLVSTVGNVSIAVFEPLAEATAADRSGEGVRIARWEIPASEAASHFRWTSQHRGLHFVRPWPDRPPAAEHVQVFVPMTTFEGAVFETEATVPVRQDRLQPVLLFSTTVTSLTKRCDVRELRDETKRLLACGHSRETLLRQYLPRLLGVRRVEIGLHFHRDTPQCFSIYLQHSGRRNRPEKRVTQDRTRYWTLFGRFVPPAMGPKAISLVSAPVPDPQKYSNR